MQYFAEIFCHLKIAFQKAPKLTNIQELLKHGMRASLILYSLEFLSQSNNP